MGDQTDKNIIRSINARQKYVGQQFGDFELVSVGYNYGQPTNTVKCVLCGSEKNVTDLTSFRRGRGEGRLCKCRYQKKQEQPKRKSPEEYIGETHCGFRVVEYQPNKGFRVECTECGKQKWASRPAVLDGRLSCNHRVPQDYSDPKWVGYRLGNLIGVGQEGEYYRFRCDCGTEILRRPTDVLRLKGASGKTCGHKDCPHHRKALLAGNDKRTRGHAFEHECARVMEEQGYPVEMTPDSGDFGVDFFAEVDGERVAFQCKQIKVEANVSAVQEVYAGGRYYDCCKFVVVAPSGFTHPAKLMAAKLGVQLETELREFVLSDLEENKIDTNQIRTFSKSGLVWEIDGEAKPAEQWCEEFGVSRATVISRMRKGMGLREAVTTPTNQTIEINGVVKSKREWCDEYGVSQQLYDYRVKYSGCTPFEALTKPKKNSRRA